MTTLDEFNGLIPQIQKIPKNRGENLTKSGKIRPMTFFIASSLYDKPLDQKSFQRTASTFYKTTSLGDLVSLTNDITRVSCRICFTPDKDGYIQILSYRGNGTVCEFNTKKPQYNSDLFKKIIRNKLV